MRAFTITAPTSGGSPVKLAFLQQPSNAVTGATITPAVQVVVQDASGNTVQGSTNPITLTLVGGTGLAGTLTVTPQNGVATFSDLTISTAGTGYTLSAASPALTSATSASFTISAPSNNPPPPAKLAFLQQPSNALVGATISPAVQVLVEDANGNVVVGATNPVTLGSFQRYWPWRYAHGHTAERHRDVQQSHCQYCRARRHTHGEQSGPYVGDQHALYRYRRLRSPCR